MDRRGSTKLSSPSARIAQSKRCVAPVESMAQIWGATSLVPPLEITSGRRQLRPRKLVLRSQTLRVLADLALFVELREVTTSTSGAPSGIRPG